MNPTLGEVKAEKPISSIKQEEVEAVRTEYVKSGTTVTSTVSMLVHPPERFEVTSYTVVIDGLAIGS